MNGIRCGANFIFFQINSPFHQCFLLNRPSFLHWFATPPLLIPGVPGIWDCFWTLHSEIEYWSFPELIPSYSDCYNFIKYFYILKVILPLLFFYKKNVDFFMHIFFCNLFALYVKGHVLGVPFYAHIFIWILKSACQVPWKTLIWFWSRIYCSQYDLGRNLFVYIIYRFLI